jgi:maltose alpha-D-glucosyltransferase/alpha-amylase
VSKDGGGVRTGARTPMQWTDEKGRGFSVKKTTYLPVSNKKGKSVESQENDSKSLLNIVRELIKIRKIYSCLNADANQKFIEYGYPGVFTRTDGNQTIIVCVNPSNNIVERDFEIDKVLLSNNADIIGNKIVLKSQSFAILLEKNKL